MIKETARLGDKREHKSTDALFQDDKNSRLVAKRTEKHIAQSASLTGIQGETDGEATGVTGGDGLAALRASRSRSH